MDAFRASGSDNSEGFALGNPITGAGTARVAEASATKEVTVLQEELQHGAGKLTPKASRTKSGVQAACGEHGIDSEAACKNQRTIMKKEVADGNNARVAE